MTDTFQTFLQDTSGATAVEYGLIAALVALAIITALTSMGNSIVEILGLVEDELGNTTA